MPTLCRGCLSVLPHGGPCARCSASPAAAVSGLTVAALLGLGLTMSGCDDKAVALYGAEPTDSGEYGDNDGDGYSVADGDCDDSDNTIYPGAEETAGDGIDSNCDESDDT
jgi:Putative metal-binding motif